MQPVGQLDKDHAQVFRHGKKDLLDIGRILICARHLGHLRQLGHTLDQFGHLGAEFPGQIIVRRLGIFKHVVQQGRHKRIHVQLHVREDQCHVKGMVHVRLARIPQYPTMRLGSAPVCPAQKTVEDRLGQVGRSLEFQDRKKHVGVG